MANTDVQSLLEATDRLSTAPDPLPDSAAAEFLATFPLSALVRLLQLPSGDDTTLSKVCRALSRVFSTPTGRNSAQEGLSYLTAALESKEYLVRRLVVEQVGQAAGEIISRDPEVVAGLAGSLAGALGDVDVGVSSQAQRALLKLAKASPEGLAIVISNAAGGAAERLLEAIQSKTSEVRLRGLSLAVQIAATSPEAAAATVEAGLLGSLATQLADTSDTLGTAAALEVLGELLASDGGAGAKAAAELFWSPLESILRWPLSGVGLDPFLACQAYKVAGALVAATPPPGRHDNTPAGPSVGQVFLREVAQVLHLGHIGSLELSEELHHAVMEAVAAAGKDSMGAEQVIRWQAEDGSIVQLLASEALARRGGHSEKRIVALHSLGTLAGAERMDDGETVSGSALLSASSETALRSSVQGATYNSEESWVDILWTLLKQPFLEVRLAAYRLGSALGVRPWAAEELSGHLELLEHVCNPSSESGRQGCFWRYGLLRAIMAGSRDSGPPVLLERLQKALDAGPYGCGTSHTSQQSHVLGSMAG